MKASKTVLIPLLVAGFAASAGTVEVKPAPAGTLPGTLTAPPSRPTTIGELSEQARQKRIAEETKPVAPTAPAGMSITVPSTEIVSSAAASAAPKAPVKKVKPEPPPEIVPGILAIARTSMGSRYVELADTNGQNRYNVGQVTPSGWTVVSIGMQYVELSKPADKKKPARHLTLSLVTP